MNNFFYDFKSPCKAVSLIGFSHFGKRGCWTDGQYSEINLSVDKESAVREVEVLLYPYFPSKEYRSSFSLESGGNVFSFSLSSEQVGSGVTINIPVSPKEKEIKIRVKVENPVSPKSFNKSSDERLLGIRFVGLRLFEFESKKASYYLTNNFRLKQYFPRVTKLSDPLEGRVGASDEFAHDKLIAYSYREYDDLEFKNSYREDMDRFIEVNDAFSKIFPVSFGDGPLKKGELAFVKTRIIDRQCDQSIILKFNSIRHWNVLPKIKNDIPWQEKDSNLIWRGTTTGIRNHGKRVSLVRNYKARYNVGFSHLNKQASAEFDKYVVGRVSVKDQLKFKYIISIEGNDVATNLKWILASNSVPVMPKSTRESWLLESQLIPYVHYVPLNDNLDNLDEVYEWCLNNDEHCKQIAENGKRYMEMFFDENNEKEIYRMIYREYRSLMSDKCETEGMEALK
ncbi:glycosyl transferase family 90 [Halomonas citrativorans]|uniref:Glycosyl transferase CAP10 domain-containing protein n=1 Tax=Halomonas citrativorans TaxID=2742612 RepID=A0ABR9FFS8_9GAMM|nr:glycosyl transferase family 90 [Halomonas citrativorans]MBE0405174.1 hypothetical protein [Halomonas citrativorans]